MNLDSQFNLKSKEQVIDIISNCYLLREDFYNLINEYEKEFPNCPLPLEIKTHKEFISFIIRNPYHLLNPSFENLFDEKDIKTILRLNLYLFPLLSKQFQIKSFIKNNPNYDWRIKDIIKNSIIAENKILLPNCAKVYCYYYNQYHDINSLLYFKELLFNDQFSPNELYNMNGNMLNALYILTADLVDDDGRILFINKIFKENCKSDESKKYFKETILNWADRFNKHNLYLSIINIDNKTENNINTSSNNKSEIDNKFSFYTNWNK